MVDATLAAQNAEITALLLQAYQNNQSALGPEILDLIIGLGQDTTAWVGGPNKPEDYRACPEYTLARRPTYSNESSGIEKVATSGIHEYRRLGNNEKTYNITLTAWVNSLRGYLEERGLDTVFLIFDPVRNTEVCLFKDWGSDKPYRVAA